jgi:N-glycosylase/DNA lyase
MFFLHAAGILPALLLKKSSCFRRSLSCLSSIIDGVTAFPTTRTYQSSRRTTRNTEIMQRMATRSSSAASNSNKKKKRAASPDDPLLSGKDDDASIVLVPVVDTSSSSNAGAVAVVTRTPPSKKPKSQRRKNTPHLPAVTASVVVTPLPDSTGSRSISSSSFAAAASTGAASNNLDRGPPCVDLTQLVTDEGFQDLQIPPEELRPSAVVTVGQSFHWRALGRSSKQTNHRGNANADSSSTAADDDDAAANTKKSSSAWGTHDATQWLGILRRRRRRPSTTTTALSPSSSSSSSSSFNVKKEEEAEEDDDDDDSSSFESLVVILREAPTTTLYRVLYPTQNDIDARGFLLEYFRLQDAALTATPSTTTSAATTSSTFGACLKDLYAEWSHACPRLRAIAPVIPGVRIIQQDPFECLMSFICSTNNNIPRITKMLNAIRRAYGTPLLRVMIADRDDEHEQEDKMLYSFPSLQQLLDHATEQELRNLGFGYRAPYIMKTIHQLQQVGGETYLHQLRAIPDANEVQEALTQFTGVGRKVADCVALFSLQQDDAIPVDVHVWKIARRDYINNSSDTTPDGSGDNQQHPLLTGSVKSLTPTVYRHVGDLFRTRFPNKSGWAHSLLFVAELPSFRPVLPQHIVDEMDKFRHEQQQLAKLAKQEDKKKALAPTTTVKKAANKK